MKLLGLLLLSFTLLSPSSGFGQENGAPETVSIKQQLKTGSLLVRLSTKENQINSLKASGFEDRATEVAKAQEEYNKETIKAFKEHYTFSPVYFFFSNNSKKVADNCLAGIFLNEQLETDPSISPDINTFFIAEIGDINTEYGNGSVKGLYLMDARFKPLDCSTFNKFCTIGIFDWKRLSERTPADLVEILNKRLNED